jgi:hypothetical protein
MRSSILIFDFLNTGAGSGNDTFVVELNHNEPSTHYIDSVVTTLGQYHGASLSTSGSANVVNLTKIYGNCDEYIGNGMYHCMVSKIQQRMESVHRIMDVVNISTPPPSFKPASLCFSLSYLF